MAVLAEVITHFALAQLDMKMCATNNLSRYLHLTILIVLAGNKNIGALCKLSALSADNVLTTLLY